MNCTPAIPDIISCSGNGVCVEGTCVCFPPWTGQGDFVFGSPSCSINLIFIQVCWSISAFLYFILIFPLAIYLARVKCRTIHRKKMLDLILIASWVVTCIFGTTFAVYRAIFPDRGFGIDIIATILVVLYFFFMYTSLHIFAYMFVRAATKLSSSRGMRKRQLFLSYLPLSYLLSLSFWIIPQILMLQANAVTMPILSTIVFVGGNICLASLAFLGTSLYLTPIINEIGVGLQNDLLTNNHELQLSKLKRLRKNILATAVIDLLTGFAFGFWPFLANNTAYFQCLIHLQNVPFTLVFTLSLLTKSESEKVPFLLQPLLKIFGSKLNGPSTESVLKHAAPY